LGDAYFSPFLEGPIFENPLSSIKKKGGGGAHKEYLVLYTNKRGSLGLEKDYFLLTPRDKKKRGPLFSTGQITGGR